MKYCFPGNLSHAAISYSESMTNKIFENPLFREANRSGVFLSSCFTHCEGESSFYFDRLVVQGTVMREAVRRWWEDDYATIYNDCTWTFGSNTTCNPTC